MPCQYYTSEEERQIAYKDLNRLTRICCDMRTILRRHNLESELCKESLEWIRQHDEEDAIRIERERKTGKRETAKLRALNKLTMDERRMLGL
jgi:hypothetical protein